MARILKRLEWIIVLMLIVAVFWIFKNIALILEVILWLLIVFFLCLWFKDYFVSNTWINRKKEVNIVFLLLALFPLYFFIYIKINYDETNKLLQKKSISWITELWKAAIMLRKPKLIVPKVIKKELKQDIREQNESWTWALEINQN